MQVLIGLGLWNSCSMAEVVRMIQKAVNALKKWKSKSELLFCYLREVLNTEQTWDELFEMIQLCSGNCSGS